MIQAATRPLLAAAAAGLCVFAAACSTGSASRPPSGSGAGSQVSVAAAQHVGFGCRGMPLHGKGSFAGMAAAPVATAVAHNWQLTDLAHALHAAGVTGTLNSARDITVFAPDNNAFTKLDKSGMGRLMTSKAHLAGALEYDVVLGRQSPAALAAGKTFKTLEGRKLTAFKSGKYYKVNNGTIVCGNITTANATVYIINRVLLP